MAVPAIRIEEKRREAGGGRKWHVPPRKPEIGYVPLEQAVNVSTPSTYLEHVHRVKQGVDSLRPIEIIPQLKALQAHLEKVKWGGVNPAEVARTAHDKLFAAVEKTTAARDNPLLSRAVGNELAKYRAMLKAKETFQRSFSRPQGLTAEQIRRKSSRLSLVN